MSAVQLEGQQPPAQVLQIYRDFIRSGSEAAYRAVEEDAARICVRFECPHPHLAIESLTEPTEVWWLNAYGSQVEVERVIRAYEGNSALMAALEEIPKRKHDLVEEPEDLFAHFRSELSGGLAWNPSGARFVVAELTRGEPTWSGSVFEASDGRRVVLKPVRTQAEAEALVSRQQGEIRIFAIRPYWGMPAREWLTADPEFWNSHPRSSPR